MKTFFIFSFLIFCSLFSFGQATIYHPFPESNAYWNEYKSWVYGPCTRGVEYYTNYLSGDTIIGKNTYHKIYVKGSGESYDVSTSCQPSSYSYQYYKGALRQDSLQKKVFFVPSEKLSETLLYDFNLKVGDTLPKTYNSGSGNIVIRIDSFLVGSNFHKKFLLSYLNLINLGPDYAIVEGVGSMLGLLNSIYPPFESSTSLACFNHLENYEYNSNCKFTLSISESDKQTIPILISPNPFSIQTILHSENYLENATLTIINTLGKVEKQISNVTGNTIILNRENLSGGLYYLRLSEKDKLYTSKILITDN